MPKSGFRFSPHIAPSVWGDQGDRVARARIPVQDEPPRAGAGLCPSKGHFLRAGSGSSRPGDGCIA